MWEPDYYVRLIPLPYKIDGVTIPNDDGSFDIYINANHSEARQHEKLQHELEHIRKDHFYCDLSICAVESEANGERQARHTLFAPGLKPGEPTKVIPLFNSLEQFRDFIETLKRTGRCGGYFLVDGEDKLDAADNS